MPRNSSGTYSLPAGNPVVTNTLIQSTWANNTCSDIGSSITDSLDRNGRGGMLAALKNIDGTAVSPAITFSSESTLGLYRVGAGVLGIAAAGALVLSIAASGLTFSNPLVLPIGSAGAPSVTFVSNTNTGLYSPGTNQVALSTNGVTRLSFDSTGVGTFAQVPVFASGATFANATPAWWKDTGGTARRMLFLNGSNEMYVGDLDNVLTGHSLHLAAQAGLSLEVNSAIVATVNGNGIILPVGQLTTKSTAVADHLHMQNDGAYISWWNGSGSTRTGYIQGTTGSDLSMGAENGAKIQFITAGAVQGVFNATTGNFGLNVLAANATQRLTVGGGVYVAGAATLGTSTGVGYFSNESPVFREYIGDGTGYSRAFSKRTGSTTTDVVTIQDAGVLLVNTSTSAWAVAGRGVIEVNGASTALIGLKTGNTTSGYIYHDGTNAHVMCLGGALTLDAGGATKVTVNTDGATVFTGAAATAPISLGSTSGAISINCATSNVFYVILNGNWTSLTTSNQRDGQTVNFFITQDATGSRTMSGMTNANGYVWPSGVAGVLSTAANAKDLLCMTWNASAAKWFCTLTKGFA